RFARARSIVVGLDEIPAAANVAVDFELCHPIRETCFRSISFIESGISFLFQIVRFLLSEDAFGNELVQERVTGLCVNCSHANTSGDTPNQELVYGLLMHKCVVISRAG